MGATQRHWSLVTAFLVIVAAASMGLRASGGGHGFVTRPEAEQPAVAMSPPDQPAGSQLEQLRDLLAELLSNREGVYGLHIIDLISGEEIGINSRTVFPAASTIKLPLAMFVASEVEAGRAVLDHQLEYSEAVWEAGTGVLQAALEGDAFLLSDLVDLALRYSDNIATNILLRHFGLEAMYRYMNTISGSPSYPYDLPNGTTPADMAHFMRFTYQKALQSGGVWQSLLDVLAETIFTDRIQAGVPDGVRVSHKIGTLPGVVNDVALIQGERPFVLAAFSMDVVEEEAVTVLSELAGQTFGFLYQETRQVDKGTVPTPHGRGM